MRTQGAEVWSCGGGTQSGAMAVLIEQGVLPKPDIAFMVDTGRERSSTWPFVEGFIRPALARKGVELQVIQAADFANIDVVVDGNVLLPGFTTINGSVGKLSPFCSGTWKRDVGERYLRSLGVETATMWLGISRDESRRIRKQHRAWLALRYPLIFEVPATRIQCTNLIRTNGWQGAIPHSACYMCSNQSDPEWIDLKRNWPEDFAAACALEADARKADPHFYLHPSCVPLAEVDFFAQHTMFSDRGCTEGCFT